MYTHCSQINRQITLATATIDDRSGTEFLPGITVNNSKLVDIAEGLETLLERATQDRPISTTHPDGASPLLQLKRVLF